ncbi:two-component system sensor histidine kinase PmrB [Martelella alba]|uniref:histidine kinase n=1 Tax=Martelella alba TaxID=2590451 RepID=A0ABY2SN21_9HYPH|nr:two-component system sensor histidine kinase PmrB [Martelella alba]TKI05810.1 two-component system sensor histidine kinase PmrB [Martelella alba]
MRKPDRPALVSMRWRLIVVLGIILLCCQFITVIWLWHESKEQIDLLVNRTLAESVRNDHVNQEIREAIAALSVPALMMVIVTLLFCVQAVSWVTQPLSRLQNALEKRSAEDFAPLPEQSNIQEVIAVTRSLNQLLARLNDTLQQDRQFTADVAHELRTPLAGIRLHLELQQKQAGVDNGPLIERVDNMTFTVEQLLMLARIRHDFTSGHYQTVKLKADVVMALREELEEMAAAHRQRLIWRLPERELTLLGNAILIRLLLRNLVENAHRYSPNDSRIEIRLSENAGGVLLLEVVDEGPGIDPDKAVELTRKFVRMDQRYNGIGLGLSIVTRITQLHDGQFELLNRQDGPGTIARVTLPSSA